MMTALHFTIALRKKRDVVLARRRARQIATFLGFDEWDAIAIAAATFDVATGSFLSKQSYCIEFQIDDEVLVVRPTLVGKPTANAVHSTPKPPTIRKRLPKSSNTRIAAGDLPWILEQLDERETSTLWQEMQRQNQELLGALLQLRRLEQKSGKLSQFPEEFAA